MALTKAWRFTMSKGGDKDFVGLDKIIKKRILSFFEDRVIPSGNPRLFGKALMGRLSAYWSYRIGDYRVIADIQDDRMTIMAISIDHRRDIYD